MTDQSARDNNRQEGSGLHPEHESWARITVRNNLVGVVMFPALTVLFISVIALHMNASSVAVLGVIGAVIVVGILWGSNPQRRKGFLANAGLTAAIKADLITELGAGDVDVVRSKGVVTLRGSVPYADFRASAADLARQRGARRVVNEIKVDGATARRESSYAADSPGVTTSEGGLPDPTWMPLEQRVREALEDDPRVDAYVMNARVEYGIAYLTGRQETVQASNAARDITAAIPGILGVSNDIEIMPSI